VPSPWVEKLNGFEKLLLLRVLRPDKLTTAIQQFVVQEMGQAYVEPPPFDLEKCYQDSTAMTPLIFVLSPGSDPMSVLLKFADGLKVPVRGVGQLLQLGQQH
jgi:dynein heavy chain